MLQYDRSKKYIIWGTSIVSARFSYAVRNRIHIEFYIDNAVERKQGEADYSFLGREVLKFEEYMKLNKDDYYIIVAVMESTYPIIKGELGRAGYEEFTQFAYYECFNKKLAILHGNCHMNIMKRFLLSSGEFSDRYMVYPNPLIQDNKEKCITDEILENCDLFIHQDIRADNEFGYQLSDEYLLPKLKQECIQVTVPNLFGMGLAFFPQWGMVSNKWNNSVLRGGADHNGVCPYPDRIIDKAVFEGKSFQEILSLIKGEVFSKEDIWSNFQTYMDKICEREKNWDIPIYSFIMQNYRKEKLFYDKGHPTNIVIKKIVIGILEKLGIEDRNISSDMAMDQYEEPVYDIVRETLGLEWEDCEIRKGQGTAKLCEKMTREEYVKEYLFWCYGLKV